MGLRAIAMLCVFAAAACPEGGRAQPPCGPLDLPELRPEAPPPKYLDFCTVHPQACALSGAVRIATDAALWSRIASVNREVNAAIRWWSDMQCYGQEEVWTFPTDGVGDCEDVALEKRRRLVASGLPSAALTMAIVHHTVGQFPHAVLLLEADGGTWVLDSLSPEIQCWDEPPFAYERRERPDGLWTRYRRALAEQP